MMSESQTKSAAAMERLIAIMARLREPGGCPWDREQTHRTLRKYVIEETYEVADAIDREDEADLIEELGDLLLQVVFHARIGEEEGRFSFADVADTVSEKMERRHPHVFGATHCDTADEVLDRWDEIKAGEKAARGDEQKAARMNIPAAFPALMRAQKIQKAAAKVGFDWDDGAGARAKIVEELAECDEALQGRGDFSEELGDLLFAVVNWSRFQRTDAEEALSLANEKFIRRFNAMEALIAADGADIETLTLPQMDEYWEQVKKAEH